MKQIWKNALVCFLGFLLGVGVIYTRQEFKIVTFFGGSLLFALSAYIIEDQVPTTS
jgi:UDP-N-acetylmuramyl pentapeptide phosphotransferase/UDP-N-acetylglucosamine-1-phosphate transferase